ncbi:energy-coupling factor transporter transmembrane component T [Azorhizobium doebereinerae]|uniref:energy-coupling factor transporter transmembrane component T n=1 Tax=Azorhizobium doebereinerae TaxID=281091 RepID=UPI000413BB40|nr:energy-coupling factor transporter transmembrane component T [Azorhizobium doebereinerae]
MMSSYLPGHSPLHRLPAGAKLLALAGLSLLLLPADSALLLAGALLAVLLAYAALGRRALARLALLRPLGPVLLLMVLLQAWAGDWSRAAVGAGFAVALRILLMVLLADLVTLSTPMQDMMDALERVLRPFERFGVAPRKLALAVALVVRFVPVLLSAWRAREEAWRARSTRRPALALVPGFLAQTLRLADHVADALDARGFGRPADRPSPSDKRTMP